MTPSSSRTGVSGLAGAVHAARSHGYGFGEIVVPLNRYVALVAEEESTSDRWVRGDAATAQRINRQVAAYAREAIYHHPDDDPITDSRLLMPQPYRNESLQAWLEGLVKSPIREVAEETTGHPSDLAEPGPVELWQQVMRGLNELEELLDDVADRQQQLRDMGLPMWPSDDGRSSDTQT